MRAVLKTAPESGAIAVREVPPPITSGDEVLVEVAAASICGSDIGIYHFGAAYQKMQLPRILGHEFAGRIASLPAGGAGDWQVGDRVVVESLVGCGHCAVCQAGLVPYCEEVRIYGVTREGGFAEYTSALPHLLHRVPDALPLAAACLAEPLSVALRAVQTRTPVRPGDKAVVAGPGPIGLLVAQLLRRAGAEVLVVGLAETLHTRLKIAGEFGLPIGVSDDLDARLAALGWSQVDLGVECSGSPAAVRQLMGVLRKGGHLTLVGMLPAELTLPGHPVVRRELTMQASYGSLPADYEVALNLLCDGSIAVEPLVTPFAMADASEAFAAAAAGTVAKPVLQIRPEA